MSIKTESASEKVLYHVAGRLALHRGDVDALICGLEGRFASRLKHIKDIVGMAPGVKDFAALSIVIAWLPYEVRASVPLANRVVAAVVSAVPVSVSTPPAPAS